MALSDEAASDEVQLALAALTKSIPIVTRSMILTAQRGEYALSYLQQMLRCSGGRSWRPIGLHGTLRASTAQEASPLASLLASTAFSEFTTVFSDQNHPYPRTQFIPTL